MKRFFKDIKSLVCDLKFIVPLLLVTVLSYGFILNHFSVGVDDLTRPRYIGGELIVQGRLSSSVMSYIFGFTEYKPFWEDLVSIIFMFFAGILIALMLKRLTKNSLNYWVYNFFACFFVTFPLINEIFIYSGAGLNIAVGYSLTFISLIIFEHFLETKKYLLLLPCLLIWIFNISMYESLVLVYACTVCGMLLLRHLIADGYIPCNSDSVKSDFRKRQQTKNIFTEIGWHISLLAVATVLEFIISNAVIKILNLTASSVAANAITSFDIKSLLLNFYTTFICSAFKYLPVTIFLICLLIGCIASIVYTKKSKHGFYLLYFTGMFFCVLALSILQSGLILYRTLQCLVIFCGIIAIVILQKALCSKRKWTKVIASVMAVLLIICQTIDLAKWFYVDFTRSEEEKRIMISVGNELVNNYDLSKPVLFTGNYTLSDEIRDYRFINEGTTLYNVLHTPIHGILETDGSCFIDRNKSIPVAQSRNASVITWGIAAFGEINTELLRYFEYLGYDFIQGTPEQYDRVKTFAETMTPKKTSFEILDTEEFIVVKFG